MLKNTNTENIELIDFSDEFKKSYIDYSMAVITDRAVPDIRDGLKPVQRRIIYDMYKLNVVSNKETKKNARIVGDTMGKYHPHGSSSIYDALVVLSQDFKRNIPLIKGQGNMGSIEGDGAAAERYTESKLQSFTENVYLKDLDKITDFIPNYDGIELEPIVLPSRLPMFLINGSEGIAVGMITAMPSHNLVEVCDLCINFISNQNLSIEKMLTILNGPDFPTGGIITNKSDLVNIYKTGTGKIKIRGKIIYEKAKNKKDKDCIVITEIPYTMIGNGINKFMNDVYKLVENKKLSEITDISNQSNKDGIRIVLECKPNSDIQKIKSYLYNKTLLQDTINVNMLAIQDKTPKLFNLKDILKTWYEFQLSLIDKKYTKELDELNYKKEIQEGLIKATNIIDIIIEIIRGSKSIEIAKKCLTTGDTTNISFKTKSFQTKAEKLDFTENQANAILKLQLQKLIGLEIDLLKKEYQTTLKNIDECNTILKSKIKKNNLLKSMLNQIKTEFGTKRKTKITNEQDVKLIEKEEIVDGYVLCNKFRYLKFIDVATYDRNKDNLDEYIFTCKVKSNENIYAFSNTGKEYLIKVKDIPLCKFKDRGEPIENISKFKNEEILIYITNEPNLNNDFIFITKNKTCKIVSGKEFITNYKEISATKLQKGDELFKILIKDKNKLVFISKDNLLKINVNNIPVLNKTNTGKKVISFKDELVDCKCLTKIGKSSTTSIS